MKSYFETNNWSIFVVLLLVLQSTSRPTESVISSNIVECPECGNSTLLCISGHWSSVNCSKCLCSCETDSQCSENEYCGAQSFSENGIPKEHACLYAPKDIENIKITPEMAMKRNIEEGLVTNETYFNDYYTSITESPNEDTKEDDNNEDDDCVPNCQVESLCGFSCDNFPDAKCIPDNCSCSSKFDLNGTEPLCYGDPDSDVDLEDAPDNVEDWFPMDPTYEYEEPEVETASSTMATTTIVLATTTKLSLATKTFTLTTTQQQNITTATTGYSTATTVATPTSFLLQMVLLPVVLLLVAMTTVLIVRKIHHNLSLRKNIPDREENKPNDQELESLKPLKTEEV